MTHTFFLSLTPNDTITQDNTLLLREPLRNVAMVEAVSASRQAQGFWLQHSVSIDFSEEETTELGYYRAVVPSGNYTNVESFLRVLGLAMSNATDWNRQVPTHNRYTARLSGDARLTLVADGPAVFRLHNVASEMTILKAEPRQGAWELQIHSDETSARPLRGALVNITTQKGPVLARVLESRHDTIHVHCLSSSTTTLRGSHHCLPLSCRSTVDCLGFDRMDQEPEGIPISTGTLRLDWKNREMTATLMTTTVHHGLAKGDHVAGCFPNMVVQEAGPAMIVAKIDLHDLTKFPIHCVADGMVPCRLQIENVTITTDRRLRVYFGAEQNLPNVLSVSWPQIFPSWKGTIATKFIEENGWSFEPPDPWPIPSDTHLFRVGSRGQPSTISANRTLRLHNTRPTPIRLWFGQVEATGMVTIPPLEDCFGQMTCTSGMVSMTEGTLLGKCVFDPPLDRVPYVRVRIGTKEEDTPWTLALRVTVLDHAEEEIHKPEGN